MATANDVRRIALALEGTTEAPHFDRVAFRPARIYATLAADRRSINLKLTPAEQDFKCMMAPAVFAPVNDAWGRQGWTRAELAALSKNELKGVLEVAWRTAQPKARGTRR